MVMLLYVGSSTVTNYIGDNLNAEKRHRKKRVGEKGERIIGGKIKKVKEKEKGRNEEEEKSRTAVKEILQCGGSNLFSIIIRHLRLRSVPRFLCVIHKSLDSVTFHDSSRVQSRLLPRKDPLLSFSLCLSVQMRFKSLKTLSVQPLYVPGTALAIIYLTVIKQDRSTSPFFLVLIM